MSDLTEFRDHCRAMADGKRHRSDCAAIARKLPWAKTPPADGCVSTSDQALFGRLADEIDTYLASSQSAAADDHTEPLWETT